MGKRQVCVLNIMKLCFFVCLFVLQHLEGRHRALHPFPFLPPGVCQSGSRRDTDPGGAAGGETSPGRRRWRETD